MNTFEIIGMIGTVLSILWSIAGIALIFFLVASFIYAIIHKIHERIALRNKIQAFYDKYHLCEVSIDTIAQKVKSHDLLKNVDITYSSKENESLWQASRIMSEYFEMKNKNIDNADTQE